VTLEKVDVLEEVTPMESFLLKEIVRERMD